MKSDMYCLATRGLRRSGAGRLRIAAIMMLVLIGAQVHPINAADGDLDSGFGKGGVVITDFELFNEGRAVAVQHDGKIVAGGETDNNGRTMDGALARYNRDGSLDTKFGTAGKVITPGVRGLNVVAIQPDGRILAGSVGELLRYDRDGALDPDFGSGGKATISGIQVHALAVQHDAKIIAGATRGTANGGGGTSFAFAVLRFNRDGSPDMTFGIGGEAAADFTGHLSGLASLAIEPDGKIIAGGSGQLGPGKAGFGAIARFNADGSLDAGFGSGGLVTTQFSGPVLALAASDDDKIVAVESDFRAGGPFLAVARYNDDGSLDSTFGNGGVVSSAFFAGTERHLITAAIGPDGKVVVAGEAELGLAVARYNADGSPDTAFGSGGSVITHITDPSVGEADTARGIAFQADDQIVVTGDASLDNHLVLARYNTEPDFDLAFAEPSMDGSAGTKVRATLNIVRKGGFNGNVTITPSDTSALDIRVVPDSVTTTEVATKFKIKIKGSAQPGAQQIVFSGRSDAGITHSIRLELVVQ